jgi:hypothetical protein
MLKIKTNSKFSIKHAGNISLPEVFKVKGEFESPWKSDLDSLAIVKGNSHVPGIFSTQGDHCPKLRTISINVMDQTHRYDLHEREIPDYIRIIENHIFAEKMMIIIREKRSSIAGELIMKLNHSMNPGKFSIVREDHLLNIQRDS